MRNDLLTLINQTVSCSTMIWEIYLYIYIYRRDRAARLFFFLSLSLEWVLSNRIEEREIGQVPERTGRRRILSFR